MEQIGTTKPKYPAIVNFMAPIRVPTLKKPSLWHPLTHLLKLIVSTIINLRFFAINHTTSPHVPYKCPPSINDIFTCASFLLCFFHVHCTLFHGLTEACVNLEVFSNSPFVHLLDNSFNF